MATVTDRPLRICMACGQVDDHPRHVIGVPTGHPDAVPSKDWLASVPDDAPATAVADLLNPQQVSRHIDCCAAAGCVVCQTTEAETKGVRGPALIDAIAGGALDGVEVPAPATNEELGLNG